MNLWKNLDKITARLKDCPTKVLMLDFDGTLTPIIKSPSKVRLSKTMRNLLSKLSKKEGFYLAILSGRSFENLKKKVNLKNIIYAGNHGLEGEIFGKKYLFPVPGKISKTIGKIKKQLKPITSQFKGTLIEDKGLTLSFHYRLAIPHQIPEIKLLINQILKPYLGDRLISVILGKKVINITPNVNWNKGHFAEMIIKKITALAGKRPAVIAIGDDTTDEDVFKMLKKGVTIRVGKNHKSDAKYSLKNTKEVFTFLKWTNKKL